MGSSATPNRPETVVTFGTFDLFHIGHLRIIQRAVAYAPILKVGVSSDDLSYYKKGRKPTYSQDERLEIVSSLRPVSEVFLEESFDLKREYLEQHQADFLVMGADWEGLFDEFSDVCTPIYLSRTPSISTTAVIEHLARPS